MAIINSGRVRAGAGSASVRRKATAARSGNSFVLDGATAPEPEAAPEPAPVSAASSLLAMQEIADPGPAGRRGQALRRGGDLLDRLDGLRLDLLSGAVSPARLNGLVDALEAERATTNDPRLDSLIAEIELRAAVEVAKRGVDLRPPGIAPGVPTHRLSHFLSKV